MQLATVRIQATGSFEDPQFGTQLNIAGSGTGFIIDEMGIAVTNNHVVTGAAAVQVFVNGEDKPRNARVLGVTECSDLAVIDIEGDGFRYLEWFENDINVGLSIFAAGYPLGDPEFTLTRGIVSKEKANGDTQWASVDSVIEHDATINPGNSGGPLVTEDGQVVAVNYASQPEFNQYFAIAREESLPVIEQLREGIDVNSIGLNGEAFLGESISGIWVYSVKAGSPADNAGIKAGDFVTKLEELVLATDGTMAGYCDILRSHAMSDTMRVEIFRSSTNELMAGQLNGTPLETTVSIPDVSYVSVTDSLDQITVDLPDTWSDIDSDPWGAPDSYGARIVASPDLDGFWSGHDVPGMFFGASKSLGQSMDPGSLLDEFADIWEGCTFDGRFDFDDSVYVGLYDRYINCGSSGATINQIAATPPDSSFILIISVKTITEADEEALSEILSSFFVYGDLSVVTPAQSGDIIFVTDFDDSEGWLAFSWPEGEDYIATTQDSVLYLEVPGTNTTVYAIYDAMANYEDVRIDAAVETVAGPNRNNISLVCRYTEAGWYEFSMNSGGFWYIWKYSEADSYTVLHEGTSNDINLQKAKNELTAICQGDTLTLIINEVEVGSATDSEFPTGQVGTSATSFDLAGVGVEFDWLLVTVP